VATADLKTTDIEIIFNYDIAPKMLG
jgi:hypothetical protein